MAALVGSVVSLIGSIFLLLAAIGIIRMPDTYNRMQTGTKATTLGSMLFHPGYRNRCSVLVRKIVLLILFIAFTNPVSSNALARAAHFIGVPLGKAAKIDALPKCRRIRTAKRRT